MIAALMVGAMLPPAASAAPAESCAEDSPYVDGGTVEPDSDPCELGYGGANTLVRRLCQVQNVMMSLVETSWTLTRDGA
jgi:hypothetical protein